MAAANIFAFIIGLPANRDASQVASMANGVIVEKFVPKSVEVSGTNNDIQMKA